MFNNISKGIPGNIQYFLFRRFLMTTFFLSLTFALINAINVRPFVNIFTGILSAIIGGIALFAAKDSNNYLASRIIFLSYFTFILVPIGYLTSPGSYSAMVYLIILILFMTTIVCIKKWEYIFPLLIIIQVPLLLRTELWFDDFYYQYTDEVYRINDLTINILVVLIAIFAITTFMMRRYDRHNNSLYEASITDSLTGLYNRRHFFSCAEVEHNRSLRTDTNYVIIFIDLNNFKHINDHHGHLQGDIILKEIGKIITNNIRAYDIAARYGGDEFIIILPNTELEESKYIIERMREKFFDYSQKYKTDKFNVGFGYAVRNDDSLDETIKQADQNLYQDKKELKDKY